MWREEVTDESWRLLQRLRSEFPFLLIGGWAVYLYTDRLKSKDIDIVVGLDALGRLKANYGMSKNSRLRKYEFTVGRVDVDTYVPFYSDLGVPAEELLGDSRQVKGFAVPPPELLLATKQKAELARRGSDKGLKDRVDILSLLIDADVDIKRYARLLLKHGLAGYLEELRRIVLQGDREMAELGAEDLGKVKRVKKGLVSRIDAARMALPRS